MRRHAQAAALAAAIVLAACGTDDTTSKAVIDPGDDGNYTVDIEPADFTSTINNPYLPMTPGSYWRYEETGEDGETETITVEVLDEHHTVMGVDTIVVHDVVSTDDGDVIEDTYDWYAQDTGGNVWYFGEDTTAYEDGVASTAGSWQAGVDGALPGIVMLAAPKVSDTGYRQEYFQGEAEDMGQVITDSGSVSTPYGEFNDVIRTRDWTPLEPDVVEEKTYARGVGFVHEVKTNGDGAGAQVQLIDYTIGG